MWLAVLGWAPAIRVIHAMPNANKHGNTIYQRTIGTCSAGCSDSCVAIIRAKLCMISVGSKTHVGYLQVAVHVGLPVIRIYLHMWCMH